MTTKRLKKIKKWKKKIHRETMTSAIVTHAGIIRKACNYIGELAGELEKQTRAVDELVTIQGRLTVKGTKEDLEALFGAMHYDDNVSSAVGDLVSELQMMFDPSE